MLGVRCCSVTLSTTLLGSYFVCGRASDCPLLKQKAVPAFLEEVFGNSYKMELPYDSAMGNSRGWLQDWGSGLSGSRHARDPGSWLQPDSASVLQAFEQTKQEDTYPLAHRCFPVTE